MKKNTLFIQIFTGFIVSIVLFSIVLIFSYYIGLSSAIDKWSDDYLNDIEKVSKRILLGENPNLLPIPQTEPIFIYDKNKILIYSNRGLGKYNSSEKYSIPIYNDNEVIGYFFTQKLEFMDNQANQQFTTAISSAILYALSISSLVVLLLALLITRKISKPIKYISKSLESLTKGNRGHTIGLCGAVELREITEALNHLSKKLLVESNIRTQWARDVAHDLRTPVAALKAQFEGMAMGVLDLTQSRINQNLNEIFRMEVLVQDLSELMKLEEPELKLYPVEINTHEFINQIITRNLKEIEERGIQLGIECNIESFFADEMLLHRAISNIWSNALRHTYNNGIINIFINKNEKYINIEIENSGDVIPHDEINKIFNRLYRGEKARNSYGSGLGLTIAQKIVKLHNGSILAKSDKENNTHFIVSILI